MPLHIRLIKVVVLRAVARVRRAMTAAHAPATLMMTLVVLELAAVLPKLVALSRVRRTILACVLVVVVVVIVVRLGIVCCAFLSIAHLVGVLTLLLIELLLLLGKVIARVLVQIVLKCD